MRSVTMERAVGEGKNIPIGLSPFIQPSQTDNKNISKSYLMTRLLDYFITHRKQDVSRCIQIYIDGRYH